MASSEPKTALLTGGEGDLAQHFQRELELAGYRVLAPGRSELDVLQATSVQSYFEALDQPLDLLVCGAGALRDDLFSRQETAERDEVIDSHLRGAFLCSKAALRGMARQRSGHLVFIGSRSGLRGPIGQTAYAAAKAGLVGLCKSLALEYGGRGIRANCLLPGFLETKMTTTALEKHGEQILAEHALGTLSSPEDAARFLVFLDSLAHVSGQVFQLDNRVE